MGGKKSSPPAPKKVDPVAEAQANLQAQINTLPQAAQVQFDILQNPEFGLLAQTLLQNQVREQAFGQESAVKDQLLENVLANLVSPTGISADQQAAIDARRGEARGDLTEALRTRANLGGGLFGGRSAGAEAEELANLENIFSQEDITREERARLNAIQAALPALQTLFPQAGLVQPNFINPVVSPNQQFSSAVAQRGQNIQNSQFGQGGGLSSSLFNSLFGGFGKNLGGGLGGSLAGNIAKNIPGF